MNREKAAVNSKNRFFIFVQTIVLDDKSYAELHKKIINVYAQLHSKNTLSAF